MRYKGLNFKYQKSISKLNIKNQLKKFTPLCCLTYEGNISAT